MKRIYHLGFFLCCFSIFANAQENFKQGFIVSNEGDTLQGEINDELWLNNPTSFSFRSNGKAVIYNVPDVLGFGIQGVGQFKRLSLSYAIRPASYREAGFDYNENRVNEVAFSRILENGKYNLFSLTRNGLSYFYLSSPNNSEVKELVYKIRVRNGAIEEDFAYKNVLNSIAVNENMYAQMEQRILKCNYEEEELMDVVGRLNGKSKVELKDTRKNAGSSTTILFDAGFSAFLGFTSSSSESLPIGNAAFSTTVNPMINAGFIFSNRRGVPVDVSIRVGYLGYTIKGETPAGANQQKYDSKLSNLSVQLSPLFRLSKERKNTVYIGPSLSYQITLSGIDGTTTTSSGVDNDFPFYSKSWLLFGGIFGYKFGRNAVEISAMAGTNMSRQPETTILPKMVSLGYRFAFAKK